MKLLFKVYHLSSSIIRFFYYSAHFHDNNVVSDIRTGQALHPAVASIGIFHSGGASLQVGPSIHFVFQYLFKLLTTRMQTQITFCRLLIQLQLTLFMHSRYCEVIALNSSVIYDYMNQTLRDTGRKATDEKPRFWSDIVIVLIINELLNHN